jgi:hypothetical protein
MEDAFSANAREDLQANFAAGIRPCGKCGRYLFRKQGCCYVKCPDCCYAECWCCGKDISHTSEAFNNHGCNPDALFEQEQRDVTKPNSLLCSMASGASCVIAYCPDWTVLQLKQEIQRKTGVNTDQVTTLTYAGATLDNSKRLVDCKIRPKSTVVLSLQQFVVGKPWVWHWHCHEFCRIAVLNWVIASLGCFQ